MEKIDWTQKAVLREKILFVCVLLAVVMLFFQMALPVRSEAVDRAEGRLKILILEKNALVKFEEVAPQITEATSLSPSMNPQFRALLLGTQRAQLSAVEFLQLVTDSRFLGPLRVMGVKSSENKQDQGYSVMSYEIKIRGDYRDVVRYVSQLEELEMVMRVDAMLMDRYKDEGSMVDFNLKIEYYVLTRRAGS